MIKIPFLKLFTGWKLWAILAAGAFAGGLWTGNRLSDAGHYKAAVEQLKTALNESELARQEQIESVKKASDEKALIRQESDRLRKQLKKVLKSENCANQPVGADALKLLQP